MLLRLDDAKIPGLYSIDGYIDVSQMADDEVVRDILNRLNMLDHNAIEKELPADAGLLVPEAKLATNAEISWDGIEVQGTYYAWAGPLLAMEDKAAIPYSPQLITACKAVIFRSLSAIRSYCQITWDGGVPRYSLLTRKTGAGL